MQKTIDHFSAITTAVMKDLEARGVLQLLQQDGTDEPLAIDSDEAQKLIRAITENVYTNCVKDVNEHRAPEL